MSGPSRRSRDAENERDRRRLGAGFVVLVGLSGGLIAIQGGASPLLIGASALAGLIVGAALLWYLLWITR